LARLRLRHSIRLITFGGSATKRGAVQLAVDKLPRRVLLAVAKRRRIKATLPALHDRLGNDHHVSVNFALAVGAELGLANLIGAAED
jgi:hypothetical protein